MGVVTEGILNMPYELAMADELSRHQYYQTARAHIDALTEERDRLKQWQADQVEVNEEAKALITELNVDKKALEAERDRLKDQRDYYKARDEEGERIEAEFEAKCDRIAEERDSARAERDRLALANAELLADQRETLKAVLYHFGPEGAQKVTAHTLEQRKARALLTKHKATSTEREGE